MSGYCARRTSSGCVRTSAAAVTRYPGTFGSISTTPRAPAPTPASPRRITTATLSRSHGLEETVELRVEDGRVALRPTRSVAPGYVAQAALGNSALVLFGRVLQVDVLGGIAEDVHRFVAARHRLHLLEQQLAVE